MVCHVVLNYIIVYTVYASVIVSDHCVREAVCVLMFRHLHTQGGLGLGFNPN